MIALIIIGYLVVGFLMSMGFVFISRRLNAWIPGEDEYFAGLWILFWPIFLVFFIFYGIIEGLKTFYNWFAYCINER